MAYEYATWLAPVLREAGLTVVEHRGWRTRGLGKYLPFKVKYVVWHHDASARGDSPGVPDSMIARMQTAGAQVWVDRQGRWHLVAAGRMPHAGTTRNGVVNTNSLGIETDHTTGEDWPPVQVASLRDGPAAIFRHIQKSASRGLHFHKTICFPPGRKVDPDGLDLGPERRHVQAIMNATDRKVEAARPKPKAKVYLPNMKRCARGARLKSARYGVSQIQRALNARYHVGLKVDGVFGRATKAAYRKHQKAIGSPRRYCDGIPGPTDLTDLGRGRFTVTGK